LGAKPQKPSYDDEQAFSIESTELQGWPEKALILMLMLVEIV
jgi:hypothetical protein